MDIDSRIRNRKKRLKDKAKESGLWENFGQKVVRELKDEYPEEKDKIERFSDWCMNYTPRIGWTSKKKS